MEMKNVINHASTLCNPHRWYSYANVKNRRTQFQHSPFLLEKSFWSPLVIPSPHLGILVKTNQ